MAVPRYIRAFLLALVLTPFFAPPAFATAHPGSGMAYSYHSSWSPDRADLLPQEVWTPTFSVETAYPGAPAWVTRVVMTPVVPTDAFPLSLDERERSVVM